MFYLCISLIHSICSHRRSLRRLALSFSLPLLFAFALNLFAHSLYLVLFQARKARTRPNFVVNINKYQEVSTPHLSSSLILMPNVQHPAELRHGSVAVLMSTGNVSERSVWSSAATFIIYTCTVARIAVDCLRQLQCSRNVMQLDSMFARYNTSCA